MIIYLLLYFSHFLLIINFGHSTFFFKLTSECCLSRSFLWILPLRIKRQELMKLPINDKKEKIRIPLSHVGSC